MSPFRWDTYLGFTRRRALGALGVAAVAPRAAASLAAPATSWASSALSARPARDGAPTALLAPGAGIDAPVEPVWLTGPADAPGADRLSIHGAQIALPATPDAVGWYALGAVPGEPGSALLVGHVDTASGPAVFWRLSALRTGDHVFLQVPRPASPSAVVAPAAGEEAAGSESPELSQAAFVVDAAWRHPASQPAPAELFDISGTPRLYLVTCAGRFVREAGGYQDRLIVRATPLREGSS